MVILVPFPIPNFDIKAERLVYKLAKLLASKDQYHPEIRIRKPVVDSKTV